MSVTNTNKQTIVCMKNKIYIYIHRLTNNTVTQLAGK